MNYLPHLKKFRVAVSLIFVIGISLYFIDVFRVLESDFINFFTYLQFIPSVLKFSTVAGWASAGFAVVIVLTFFFGRIYCSTICPLGAFQDLIIRISKKSRRVKYSYKKDRKLIKYSTLITVLILFVSGYSIGLLLLDPFSNYGRFLTGIARPILMGINNFGTSIFEGFGIYYLYPLQIKGFSAIALVLVFGFFTGLILLSFFKGRLFCNTLCPVGILLGLVSKFSLYKIKIDSKSCRNCGVCEFVCKANCIDSPNGNIDFERCIGCYNCLTVCPEIGIKFTSSIKFSKDRPALNEGRRYFLSAIVIYAVSSNRLLKTQTGEKILNLARIPEVKRYPVSPPGSVEVERFTLRCTGCHLCVSGCPTQVLQPSFLEYGLLDIQKPLMNFSVSYCNYDCTICGEVCPSGAILPLEAEVKKLTQIGTATLVKENCIVFNQGTACSACSEHCPTKAVHTVPYKNLLAPEVDNKICIGCGACEFACPTKPHKAIYVVGNPYHLEAEKPPIEESPVQSGELEEFPF